MPFLGVDPWRWQYFEGVPCPDHIVVPIDDATAWELYPRHRWIYNKLAICETQGLAHGPHAVMPTEYPVFSKPIVNLRGLGTGGRIISSDDEFEDALTPGHMWMPLMVGPHVSSDVAVVDGEPRWWRHTTGKPLAEGMFDHWTVHAERRPRLERYCGDWLEANLGGFTGIVNFETIGGRIIECHLRMAEQWIDLNGPGWLAAVVRLYAEGEWRFEHEPRTGYSVVLFGPHGPRYRVDPEAIRRLLEKRHISSIQVTFDEQESPESHAMPPGGFRLAIVNCWNLAAGKAARQAVRALVRTVEDEMLIEPFVRVSE
jgi:hypothetical protein